MRRTRYGKRRRDMSAAVRPPAISPPSLTFSSMCVSRLGSTLTRVQQYAAFVRERDRAKMTKEQAMDEERRINMMIDWHDFVGTLIIIIP